VSGAAPKKRIAPATLTTSRRPAIRPLTSRRLPKNGLPPRYKPTGRFSAYASIRLAEPACAQTLNLHLGGPQLTTLICALTLDQSMSRPDARGCARCAVRLPHEPLHLSFRPGGRTQRTAFGPYVDDAAALARQDSQIPHEGRRPSAHQRQATLGDARLRHGPCSPSLGTIRRATHRVGAPTH
jgi:hypothetical protein